MADDIRSYLMAGEKILWSGKPQQGLRFAPIDAFLVPFSLFWGGMALFGAGPMLFQRPPGLFALFPLLFLSMAAYVTFGRLLQDIWVRARTDYLLTDRRVVIHRRAAIGRLGGDLVVVNLTRGSQVRYKPGLGDRGTLIFGVETPAFSIFRRGNISQWVPSLDPTARFIGIEHARRVFDQIQTLQSREA